MKTIYAALILILNLAVAVSAGENICPPKKWVKACICPLGSRAVLATIECYSGCGAPKCQKCHCKKAELNNYTTTARR